MRESDLLLFLAYMATVAGAALWAHRGETRKIRRMLEQKLSSCPACRGSGDARDLPCCPRCGGSGEVDPYTGDARR